MSKNKSASNNLVPILTSIIGLIGTFIVAYFAFRGNTASLELIISATQTAESRAATAVALTNIAGITPTNNTTITESISTVAPVISNDSGISYFLPTTSDISKLPGLMEGIFYKNPKEPSVTNYQVNVTAGISYVWQYTWCAQDESRLNDNLSLIDLKFFIENSEIPNQDIYRYQTTLSGWNCRVWATLLSGWTQEEDVQLTLLYKISGQISDGKYTYEPGEYRHDIFISVP